MTNPLSSSLKITKVAIYKMTIPLKSPFAISLGAITHAENIVIKIHTNQSIYGIGECSPFPTIHGETQEVETDGTINVKDGKISANSNFEVAVADYKISIPKVVRENIAKIVSITVNIDYELFKKKS